MMAIDWTVATFAEISIITLKSHHWKILIVSDPDHGILNPAFRFANHLKMGIHVTFSTSYSGIRHIDKETTLQGLTFVPFSDGHDNGKQPTAEIISSAAAAGQLFDHLVYTTVLPWAATVATGHNVKSTFLWCQPSILLVICYYYFHGYESLISSIGNYLTFPISLPGLPPLTMADLSSFLLPPRPKEHNLIHVMIDHFKVLKTAPRILVNTFNELEIESIKAVDKVEFLPIGPLIPLDKPDDDCIRWLNTKPELSVVYVSFGTLATLSMNQVDEIAIGLLESGRPFLWVIRDSEQAGRLSKTEDLLKLGMIVDWCFQMAVLTFKPPSNRVFRDAWWLKFNNRSFDFWCSYGGVSTMVGSGDECEDVWIRVKNREVDGVVEGKEIKRCVEILMAGGENCEMRNNAVKWRDLAREALNNGGSSTLHLQFSPPSTFNTHCQVVRFNIYL